MPWRLDLRCLALPACLSVRFSIMSSRSATFAPLAPWVLAVTHRVSAGSSVRRHAAAGRRVAGRRRI